MPPRAGRQVSRDLDRLADHTCHADEGPMMTPEENQILRDMHGSVGAMKANFESLCDRIDTHHQAIYGNGNPGLRDRVSSCEGEIDRAKTMVNWVWTAMISVVTSAAAAATAWYKNQQ